MAGVVFFVVVVFLMTDLGKFNTSFSIIVLVGLVVAIPAFLCSFVVPRIVANTGLKTTANKLDDDGHKFDSETGLKSFFGIFQLSTILRYAMIEGAVFLNLCLFVVEASVVSPIVAAIGLVIMILMFPRRDPTLAWVEQRVSDLIQGRV